MLRHLLVLAFPVLLLTSAFAQPVRVMSYNIHHGEGLDGRLDLERIARLIVEQKADVVALQEVDRKAERTQKRDLPAELAKLTGMQAYFERNIPLQGGEYGNAVLTKFPVKRVKNTHYKIVGEGEQRGVMQLVLEVRGREVLFMNTHLDHRRDEAERLLSADTLQELVSAAGRMPLILVGDFNAAAGSRTHQRIRTLLTDAWEVAGRGDGFTIPVRKPTRRIDYIFVSRDTIEPVRMEVLQSEASDHLPILAELQLK